MVPCRPPPRLRRVVVPPVWGLQYQSSVQDLHSSTVRPLPILTVHMGMGRKLWNCHLAWWPQKTPVHLASRAQALLSQTDNVSLAFLTLNFLFRDLGSLRRAFLVRIMIGVTELKYVVL